MIGGVQAGAAGEVDRAGDAQPDRAYVVRAAAEPGEQARASRRRPAASGAGAGADLLVEVGRGEHVAVEVADPELGAAAPDRPGQHDAGVPVEAQVARRPAARRGGPVRRSSPSTTSPESSSAVSRAATAVRDRPVSRPTSLRVSARPSRISENTSPGLAGPDRSRLALDHFRRSRTGWTAYLCFSKYITVLASTATLPTVEPHARHPPRPENSDAPHTSGPHPERPAARGPVRLRRLRRHRRPGRPQAAPRPLPPRPRRPAAAGDPDRRGLPRRTRRGRLPRQDPRRAAALRPRRRARRRHRRAVHRPAHPRQPRHRRRVELARAGRAALRPATRVRVFYLAIGPALFGPVSQRLAEHGLVTDDLAAGAGEADRPRPGLRPRGQRRGRRGLRGAPDLPDRPLPRQGERAEPAGDPVRQHVPRAAVERQLHRPRADHRLRVARRRQPRRLLRRLRRAARHGPEPPAPAALPGRHGAPDVRRPRDRPRREAQGAPGAAPDRPARTSTAPSSPGSTPRPRRRARRPVVPQRRGAPGLDHRDLRGDPGRGAELALGRGAVLPAHRQADGPARARRS